MRKADLVTAIIERLRADVALYHKAALAARAEATHEQSRAENKYDTRGLEASYLARGQSRQVAEIEQAIILFEKLNLREWASDQVIDTGALINIKSGRESNFYFMGPRAGGTEVTLDGQEVMVITPESPLGSQLIGKKQGERCIVEIGGKKQSYTISLVS